MIYKRCPRCGERIPSGTYCAKCRREARKTGNRTDGIRKEYKSAAWTHERESCLRRFSYIDLYALYHDGRIVPADQVHHIEEILDSPERFHDPLNHFPVSQGSHHDIHWRYKHEDKEAVQKELLLYIRKWKESTKNS